MKLATAAVAAAMLAIAVPTKAAAQPSAQLGAALRAGIVGERYDGYMGYPGAAPAAIQKQVAAVNIRRRTLYLGLSSRRGVTPQAAGIATGCQLLARIEVGQAYMWADGQWRRRLAGQPAPVPSYCR
ncbi:MAG TPA: DUF1318 domain-containing protein [Sphingomicrobium sp.]|nr:DUF1318 domain-containing protein [Sphingomicrobium sp.]